MFGEQVSLSKYEGDVLVVVNNVNFPSLRYFYEEYGEQGFNVLAFPCNQFGFQSPGSSEDERLYTLRKFGLETLPVFDKVEVNGRGACDVYRFLKQQQPNAAPLSSVQRGGNANISWNFEKFLVGRDGVPLARYKPSLDPRAFEADLRLALAGKPARPAECLSHPGRIVCTQPMKEIDPDWKFDA
eukprot:PRCOL_00000776-RA